MKGHIKRLQPTYGFIRALDGSEYFFLPMATQGVDFSSLKPGDEVEFETFKHEKGDRARNISLVKE